MKNRPLLSRINNFFVFALLTVVVVALIVSSNFLIKNLREKEAERIKVFATAIRILQDNQQKSSETQELLFAILTENDQIPSILTDENKNPFLFEGSSRNIAKEILADPNELNNLITKMETHYDPFEIEVANGDKQLVFYDNSELLNNLRYYPYFLGLFILAYLLFSFWFLRTIKKTDEGYLWAGLAKETAHQIGTPLSSMIGWMEIMKLDNPESEGVHEIEKDIERLRTISERFSKIGSVPELNDRNFNETIQENYDYLKTRISRKINFTLNLPTYTVLVPHNKILMSWVIENLVKNAVDAMKGEGAITMSVFERNKNILIEVKDNGSGMTKQQARNAFNPGYSTKKRGWGLGLSLARRVIHEYHNGDIKIAQTEVGKGTTFRIILRKLV
ncbi:histidine kinase/DNA gyrase B/HSP90-like ATPase [Chryseobacterium sp. CBTAP 102]|uniref:sensor histidine kinase n=1 Tax=Chryseobacterium sp. CBTAP 102 TaxID=2135644 RepID=UPI000D752757|nr:HAMP domain-containing sensor histidine kinase [Chryseobacterium sp. CBTAP 102]PXW18240.1 histidine kinase/DNA gyrase B/HSP90-like ATPase [Chryseobacterium sp. CBTAP 102]